METYWLYFMHAWSCNEKGFSYNCKTCPYMQKTINIHPRMTVCLTLLPARLHTCYILCAWVSNVRSHNVTPQIKISTYAADDFANLNKINVFTGKLDMAFHLTWCYIVHWMKQHCMWILRWQQKPYTLYMHDHAAQVLWTSYYEVKLKPLLCAQACH